MDTRSRSRGLGDRTDRRPVNPKRLAATLILLLLSGSASAQHSLVPATVIAPPAAAQPSAGALNESEARATPGNNEIEIPRSSFRREYEWYVRDGVAVGSPVRFDGVDIDEERRRDYDEVHNVIPEQELRRHHIGMQVGIFNPSTDVIELGNLDLDIEGNRFVGALNIPNYRYSLNPHIDLALDISRHWIGRWSTPTSGEVKLAAGYIGPSIRVNGLNRTKGKRVIPYLQGNIYYVHEQLTTSETRIEHGVGFGLHGGVDLYISRLISIPIEATYVGTVGNDIDDLSGFGLFVGVTFNF